MAIHRVSDTLRIVALRKLEIQVLVDSFHRFKSITLVCPELHFWQDIGISAGGKIPEKIEIAFLRTSDGQITWASSTSVEAYRWNFKRVYIPAIEGEYSREHLIDEHGHYIKIRYERPCVRGQERVRLDLDELKEYKRHYDRRHTEVRWDKTDFRGRYTFDQIMAMQPGDVLAELTEHPFEVGTGPMPSWITSGPVRVPRKSPASCLSVPAMVPEHFVTAANRWPWQIVLRVIDGRYHDDVDTADKLNTLVEAEHARAISVPFEQRNSVTGYIGECLYDGIHVVPIHRPGSWWEWLRACPQHFRKTEDDNWRLLCLTIEGRIYTEVDDVDKLRSAITAKWVEILATPFIRDDRHQQVTNGYHSIPYQRPHGLAEWNRRRDIRFLQPISANNWKLMLDAICGKCFNSFNTVDKMQKEIRNQRVIKRSESRIRRVQGECFDDGIFDDDGIVEVGLGERLIFIGSKDGRKVYVVDSPNHGNALYVFTDESTARDWANGRIGFRQARTLASACIVHRGDWRDRAASAVA